MLLATKLTIISNLCSTKGIKVMENSTFFEFLCKHTLFCEGRNGKYTAEFLSPLCSKAQKQPKHLWKTFLPVSQRCHDCFCLFTKSPYLTKSFGYSCGIFTLFQVS